MNNDIPREHLYEAVKTLVESPAKHVHLCQPKLYTLFSIAFQYMLFLSTKEKGNYIIRIEDSFLAMKLARRAKDASTRKFMDHLNLPRKLKYGESTFYLDFFHIGTWSMTKDLDKTKVRGAIIVKDASPPPVVEDKSTLPSDEEVEENTIKLPENYYLTSLKEFVPRTITIAFEKDYPELEQVRFPFIKEKEKGKDIVRGVKISSDIELENFED